MFLVICMYSFGEGNGTPLQYSCLENPMDGGAWWAVVHGSLRVSTTEQLHFHALEKEMATHSSVLAWRIPGKGEPGGLPSMGSHRVGHDWCDLAAAAAVDPLTFNVMILLSSCGWAFCSSHLFFVPLSLFCPGLIWLSFYIIILFLCWLDIYSGFYHSF